MVAWFAVSVLGLTGRVRFWHYLLLLFRDLVLLSQEEILEPSPFKDLRGISAS